MNNKSTKVLKKATSAIRNRMFLDFGIVELVTGGSIKYQGEIVQEYHPNIHEACEHAPTFITYDDLGDGEIKNIEYIRQIVKKIGARAYVVGEPMCFNAPDSGGDVLVANFPLNFYRFKNK